MLATENQDNTSTDLELKNIQAKSIGGSSSFDPDMDFDKKNTLQEVIYIGWP